LRSKAHECGDSSPLSLGFSASFRSSAAVAWRQVAPDRLSAPAKSVTPTEMDVPAALVAKADAPQRLRQLKAFRVRLRDLRYKRQNPTQTPPTDPTGDTV
jgi:hypothetical protein